MSEQSNQNWERDALTKVATMALTEQRRARRWGIFFKSLTFLYLALILLALVPSDFRPGDMGTEPHVAVIDVHGVIADEMDASADNFAASIRAAYDNDKMSAVILRINSPGGSPVQAGQINREIRRLKDKHPDIPVYAVITDVCASGGYFVAAAADRIYADRASVVGSIGVRMGGFGFVEAIDKLGIERRLMTAGDHKGLMDPFQPVDEAARSHLQTLLDDIHTQFIDVVREGRGDRLADNPELFSGLIWTGEQSLELGLIDGFGSPGSVARDVLQLEKVIDYTRKNTLLQEFAKEMGASMVNLLSTSLQLR